MTWWTRL